MAYVSSNWPMCHVFQELGKNWEKIQLERDIIVDNDHTDTESEEYVIFLSQPKHGTCL